MVHSSWNRFAGLSCFLCFAALTRVLYIFCDAFSCRLISCRLLSAFAFGPGLGSGFLIPEVIRTVKQNGYNMTAKAPVGGEGTTGAGSIMKLAAAGKNHSDLIGL